MIDDKSKAKAWNKVNKERKKKEEASFQEILAIIKENKIKIGKNKKSGLFRNRRSKKEKQ